MSMKACVSMQDIKFDFSKVEANFPAFIKAAVATAFAAGQAIGKAIGKAGLQAELKQLLGGFQ